MSSNPVKVKVSMKAVVCCTHGVEKRKVNSIVADTSREQVLLCNCCGNLYSTDFGDPVDHCHNCRKVVNAHE